MSPAAPPPAGPLYDARAVRPPTPHPIPYQGSKRRLAPRILGLVEGLRPSLFCEPCAGSAALTLQAAARGLAPRFLLNDSLAPLIAIWNQVIHDPGGLAARYEQLWAGHAAGALAHYYAVRDEFNRDGAPEKLLYLLARCVKNAVRFNEHGEFNQSADKRRLGTRPERMRGDILGAHALLKSRTETHAEDYADILAGVEPGALVYLDPPWQGTSGRRDTRYHRGLDLDQLCTALDRANSRGLLCLLSFDGSLGGRAYGAALPDSLGMRRLSLPAGRSSQATLSGRDEETVESLYVSPALTRALQRQGRAQVLEAATL